MTATRSRDAFLGVTKSRVHRFSAVVCMGRPLRAHVLIEILRILMGERSVAHPELSALFDVYRCEHFLGTAECCDLRTRLGVTEARA